MKKIFISGKITGEPVYECAEKFRYAWLMILEGWNGFCHVDSAVNPLELEGIHFGISHEEAMKICFDALKECTHIYMLEDWEESKGAKMEHEFAKQNGLTIIYEK